MTQLGKAIILAAGIGKRLLPYTNDLPKCLINVAGKPILQYQLEALLDSRIYDVIIVLGFLGSKIVEFISTSPFSDKMNFHYVENKAYANTNSAFSFFLARSLIAGEHILHIHSDHIFFPSTIRQMLADDRGDILIVDRNVRLDDSIQQVRLKGGMVIQMEKTPHYVMHGKACGIAKFSPSTTELLISSIHRDVIRGKRDVWFYSYIGANIEKLSIYGLESPENTVIEINTQEDLKRAERLLGEKTKQAN